MNVRSAFAVYRGYRVPHLQLIEHRNWWFIFSGILIALSLIGIVVAGSTSRSTSRAAPGWTIGRA